MLLTVILVVLLIAWGLLALRSVRRGKGCGCGCSGCSHAAQCRKKAS